MSKVREVERVITVIGNSEKPVGDWIITRIIPVRRGVPLPDLGQRVIVMDDHRIIKFAGEVTDVDFENHQYTIQIRKTADETLQVDLAELTPLPEGPVRRIL